MSLSLLHVLFKIQLGKKRSLKPVHRPSNFYLEIAERAYGNVELSKKKKQTCLCSGYGRRAVFLVPFCCSKESRSLRVVRVELDNGQRLVGLRFPEQLIPEATLFLKEQKLLDAVIVSKY